MPDRVPSVDRALSVLEILAASRQGLSLSDLSRRLSLPKSSVFLILKTLERRGYLLRGTANRRYRFGLQLVTLGHAALSGMKLRDEAAAHLHALARTTGMAVHLSVLDRSEAVIIEKVEPPGLPRFATWIGRRMDLNCTGAGKALIMHLTSDEFDRRFRPGSFARHNENSIVSIKRLKADLAEARARGYAIDDEEDEIGVRCVGVPVFDGAGAVVAAISVSGTVDKLTTARIPTVAKAVQRAAQAASGRSHG
jgi:DNA-binding IclR family transcriptional regulator